jgi:hypothetical protein
MRKPRLEAFDSTTAARQADEINMAGVIPLRTKPPVPPVKTITIHESQSATMTARQHDGKLPQQLDSTMAWQQEGLTANTPERAVPLSIEAFLREKATQKTTIRLPETLLHKLEETLYHIKHDHHIRLSMNEIFVTALASFCAEYEQQGIDSPLCKLLKKAHK